MFLFFLMIWTPFLVDEAHVCLFSLTRFLISTRHNFVCFSFQLKKEMWNLLSFNFSCVFAVASQLTLHVKFLFPPVIDKLLVKFNHTGQKFVLFYVCLGHRFFAIRVSSGSNWDLWLRLGLQSLDSWWAAWVTSGIYAFAQQHSAVTLSQPRHLTTLGCSQPFLVNAGGLLLFRWNLA